MVELHPDETALFRFLRVHGCAHARDEDLGYGFHAWLTAAFSELAPAPFRVMRPRRGSLRVLGYAAHGDRSLRQRLVEVAEPVAAAVCAAEDIVTKEMPASWTSGRRLGFEILCCPVMRRTTESGVVEKDALLIRADTAGDDSLNREDVYSEWLEDRVTGAAKLESTRLDGFRLVRTVRRSRAGGASGLHALTRPQALLRGTLTVEDPRAFATLLKTGVGRHRSFGYGMLLLRPAS